MDASNVLHFAPGDALTPTWVCHLGAESVSIWGRSHRIDLGERKLSIEWEASCGSTPSGGLATLVPRADTADTAPWGHAEYAVGVYLTDATGEVISYDPAKFLGPGRFETEHELHASGNLPVPFDSYVFQVFAHTVNPATNQPVDIAVFSGPDPPSGFTIRSTDTEVAKQFTYNTVNGPTTTEVRARALTVAIRYSNLTVALTACMFAANWVLTLASLYIIVPVVTERRVTWPTLILHSTMLLVIPAIRGLYLCPPPIGAFLDTASFFSQVIILSSCSIALLRNIIAPSGVGKGSSHDVQKA